MDLLPEPDVINTTLKRRTLVWLVPAFLTLHNVEEAVAFKYYFPRLSTLLPEPFATFEARLSYSTLLTALGVVTALAFLVAIVAGLRPGSRWALWVLLALEATMALNAIAHVLSAVFVFRGYGPGLVTAVAVNVPFAVYCFRRARREQWVSPAFFRATLPMALLLHGPVLIGGLWLAGIGAK